MWVSKADIGWSLSFSFHCSLWRRQISVLPQEWVQKVQGIWRAQRKVFSLTEFKEGFLESVMPEYIPERWVRLGLMVMSEGSIPGRGRIVNKGWKREPQAACGSTAPKVEKSWPGEVTDRSEQEARPHLNLECCGVCTEAGINSFSRGKRERNLDRALRGHSSWLRWPVPSSSSGYQSLSTGF